MKKSLVALAVLAAASAPGFAATFANVVTTGETGAGTYAVAQTTQDTAFSWNLGPGTYQFTVDLGTSGNTQFTNVWLSTNTNKGCCNPTADYGQFTVTPTTAGGSLGAFTFATASTVYFDVKTRASGNTGFNGSLSVAAVPEPASTALFLAGLGALGIVSRRRKPQA